MPPQNQQWRQHPLFADLPATFVDQMAATATVESFAAREVIFHEGDTANRFHLITAGDVALEVFAHARGPVTIQTLGVGEVLGWSWLIPPYRWHFDAHAVDATDLIVFDAAAARDAFDRHPEFGYAMLKRFLPIIVQRLQATRLQLLDVYDVRA
ncbi:MAG: cyclic nucleotide-binding domain-containing protein [Planctomycetota bacterium]|nr:MAG: cyclic nucleotide-binding domain-containing protein [Planctomycetota bacterium]